MSRASLVYCAANKLVLQLWCEVCHNNFTTNLFCMWVGRLCLVTLQEVCCKAAASRKKLDLSSHVKLLAGVSDLKIWKRKIKDLMDYHEGAIAVIYGKLVRPEPLLNSANADEIKYHKERSDFYRKSNGYVMSMIASTVTDAVYQKIMDKETTQKAWEALKQQFEAA
ncbi:hypothetical protein AVEN_171273-1 [Araneus ventricosus]|uniref:Uncharacterized protein n=1 Tax=Araneus ventricosus TaxID=182803 RepID=A0A4Y2UA42_ARAVE|nr:hypothetical protein AVEN_171273-1 [Araneus ventricosus]